MVPYHAPVSRPLRLAYLADPNSVHTRRWLGFFAERGHDVHLLVGERDEVRDLPDGITLHRYRRFGPRRLPLVSSLQGRGRLRVALRSIDPDVLHAHYLTRHGWQARLSGFHPYVASPWGSDLFVTPRESLRARIWAWLTLVGADLVTVVSDHMHDEVARYGVAARPDRARPLRRGYGPIRTRPLAHALPGSLASADSSSHHGRSGRSIAPTLSSTHSPGSQPTLCS